MLQLYPVFVTPPLNGLSPPLGSCRVSLTSVLVWEGLPYPPTNWSTQKWEKDISETSIHKQTKDQNYKSAFGLLVEHKNGGKFFSFGASMSDSQCAIRAKYCIALSPFWQNTLHILSEAKNTKILAKCTKIHLSWYQRHLVQCYILKRNISFKKIAIIIKTLQ